MDHFSRHDKLHHILYWPAITIKFKIFTRDDYLTDPFLILYIFSYFPGRGTAQTSVVSHMGTHVKSLLQCYGKNGIRSFPRSHNILKLLASERDMELVRYSTCPVTDYFSYPLFKAELNPGYRNSPIACHLEALSHDRQSSELHRSEHAN